MATTDERTASLTIESNLRRSSNPALRRGRAHPWRCIPWAAIVREGRLERRASCDAAGLLGRHGGFGDRGVGGYVQLHGCPRRLARQKRWRGSSLERHDGDRCRRLASGAGIRAGVGRDEPACARGSRGWPSSMGRRCYVYDRATIKAQFAEVQDAFRAAFPRLHLLCAEGEHAAGHRRPALPDAGRRAFRSAKSIWPAVAACREARSCSPVHRSRPTRLPAPSTKGRSSISTRSMSWSRSPRRPTQTGPLSAFRSASIPTSIRIRFTRSTRGRPPNWSSSCARPGGAAWRRWGTSQSCGSSRADISSPLPGSC